jgi:hypothetical protein
MTAKKKGTTIKTKRKSFPVHKTEKKTIIEPTHYVDISALASTQPTGFKKASYTSYGRVRDEGTNSTTAYIKGARIYKVAADTACIQFSCGDMIFVSIKGLEKVAELAKSLAITKQPVARNKNGRDW